MSFAQGSSCQRSAIWWSESFGKGLPLTTLTGRTVQEALGSERARVGPAVDQEVLARDEARVRAADERTEPAELRRAAEAARGGGPVAVTHDLLGGPAARLRLDGDRRA